MGNTDEEHDVEGAQERMLTYEDVGAKLQVSAKTVRRLLKKGLIPEPRRLTAKVVRWPATVITAWISCGCPTAEAWERMCGR